MALFNKETKEEKIDKIMSKYGLENISEQYRESVVAINQELLGTNFMEAGLKIGMAPAQDQCKIAYLNTLIQQNWMIIRQLDDISKKLDK